MRYEFTLLIAVSILVACASTSGCSSTASLQEHLNGIPASTPRIDRDLKGNQTDLWSGEEGHSNADPPIARQAREVHGTGRFVERRPRHPNVRYSEEQTHDARPGVTLNLLNVSIEQAAKTVLGEILGVNYTVSDEVTGTITIQTTNPVAKAELARALETTLSAKGIAIVQSGAFYRLIPANTRAARRLKTANARSTAGIGTQVLIVPLRFVSADDMQRLVVPVATKGAVLHADKARNILFLTGTSEELENLTDLVHLFDVDWMQGMSFAIYPVQASDPEAITRELETVFGIDQKGPLEGVIRFIPNRRLGSILVVSKQPEQLDKAREWVQKLDQAAELNQKQLFVYKIQNQSAGELAEVLQRVLSLGNQQNRTRGETAPRFEASDTSVSVSTGAVSDGVLAAGRGLENPSTRSEGTRDFQINGISVVANESNNALLIEALPKDYRRIHRILTRLDVLPTQVMLEAVIAEVTLNDDLRFGVKWYLEQNQHSFTLSNLASGAVQSQFPGFSYFFAAANVQVVLDMLSEVTKVNVVSSPSLMVMDNRKATLQIGDQVPIATQAAQSVTDPDSPIVNSIELKDTGVIFSVVPRVNDSGRVVLEVEQEVSDVVQTTTSDIDSPTIQQRRINTTVVVRDGEVVALGGLIQQRDEVNKSQVPLLGDLPYVGSAFRSKETLISRTELVIFIRPTVVRDAQEARAVTDEFRNRLNLPTLQPTRGDRHYRRDLDRAIR